jgi:HAE1 family hydrophobic/amphiphilic exporter-1
VRGVGAVSIVGGVARQLNVYLKPDALEAMGVGVDQVAAAVRSENQELPLGAIRSREQERVVQIDARLKRPEDFRDIVVARKGAAGTPVRLWQIADVTDGPQEIESRSRSTAASARCCCRCRSRRARTPSPWSTG